jgi:hypothetical protein
MGVYRSGAAQALAGQPVRRIGAGDDHRISGGLGKRVRPGCPRNLTAQKPIFMAVFCRNRLHPVESHQGRR